MKAIHAKEASVKEIMKCTVVVLHTQTEELKELVELLGHVVVGIKLGVGRHDEKQKKRSRVEIINEMKPNAHHGAAL